MATPPLCSVDGCEKPTYLGPYCAMHRTRLTRHGLVDLPAKKSQRADLVTLLGGVTVFGDLTVIGEQDGEYIPGNGAPRLLLCRCACGTEKLFPVSNVKRGLSKSCGCKRGARVTAAKTRHGQNRKGQTTPEYRSWAHAVGRCHNPSDKSYHSYGGRGIIVCQQWRDSFEAFFAYMGPRPKGHSLDRIDVNGNYEPGNVRWATDWTQHRNKTTNRILEWRGRSICLKDAAAEAGLHRSTVERRLAIGWSVEDALETPGRKS